MNFLQKLIAGSAIQAWEDKYKYALTLGAQWQKKAELAQAAGHKCQAALDKVNMEKQALTARMVEIEGAQRLKTVAYDQALASIQKREHEITSANGQISAKDQQLGELDHEIASLSAMNIISQERIGGLQEDYVRVTSALKAAEMEAALAEELSSRVTELQKDLDGARSALEAAEAAEKQWREHSVKQEAKVVELQAELKKATRNDRRDPETGRYVGRANRGTGKNTRG